VIILPKKDKKLKKIKKGKKESEESEADAGIASSNTVSRTEHVTRSPKVKAQGKGIVRPTTPPTTTKTTEE
jgi:hypothetical protein